MAEGLELEFNERNMRIGIAIAAMAAVLSFSEAFGQNAQGDALRGTVEASNLWAFYQAKTIRMTTLQADAKVLEIEAMGEAPGPKLDAMNKQIEEWKATAARYDSEPEKGEGRKELMERAKAVEAQRDLDAAMNGTFDLSSAALQIGILLASTAVVTGVLWLAFVGGALGVLGTILVGFGLWAPFVFG